MQQKAIIKCKNLLGNTLIRRTFSEIEVKLLHAIRGASRGGICLADSEAQGSAVRQFLLCYRLDGRHGADAAAREQKSWVGNSALLMIEQIAITIHLQRQ